MRATEADVMRVDWGDGVSALDRTYRAAVMMADGAIQHLLEKGWDRDLDEIDVFIGSDVSPSGIAGVKFRGRTVYSIVASRSVSDDGITVRGVWSTDVRSPSLLRRLWRHVVTRA